VTEAARSSTDGRWHGAVFISHVWKTLQARGIVGITFERFKRRLIEAYQKDLIELSRADLVDAMPAADVSASETVHSGARFHFVRLEQLAS
jgi:beta-galactosidase GanA